MNQSQPASKFDSLFDDPPPEDDTSPSLIGELVGQYRITELLTETPVAYVFAGRDEVLGRHVAVKLFRIKTTADRQQMKRFLIEARTLANIRHPNVLTLYSVNDYEGAPVLVMEFVSGGTLYHKLRNQAFAVEQVLPVMLRISRAVAAAHSLGIVHRDLKPENILIDSQVKEPALETAFGFLKVADFGIAKLVGNFEALTLSGISPGTPCYMSPEQIADTGRIGPPCDVHAIGLIGHRMLTGQPVFLGATMPETLRNVQDLVPPSLELIAPDAPPWMSELFARCLAKNPDDRFPDAVALADFIESHSDEGCSNSVDRSCQFSFSRPPSNRYKALRIGFLLIWGGLCLITLLFRLNFF